MNKEFIPYQQALALKELGFDEPCLALYIPLKNGASELEIGESNPNKKKSKLVSAPLYQQAFRWFRGKYEIYTDLFVDDDKTFGFMISYFEKQDRVDKPIVRGYNTYEEVEQACLTKLIEIIKV